MRLLHIADLHIGKRVCEFSMLEDQRHVLSQVVGLVSERGVDAVLVAGDLYDKSMPSAEAVALVDWFLESLAATGAQAVVIPGNHDSAERVAYASGLLGRQGIHVAPVYDGHIEPVRLADERGAVDVWPIPYLHISTVRHYFPDEQISNYTDALRVAIDACDLRRIDDEGRPVFTLDFGLGETIDTLLAIPGAQSVPNAVKAAAVAYRLGVTPEQIDAAFRGLTITGHRQEIKRAKSGARVIDDSYNASAESMAAGLDLLCSLSCTGSRMAVLGEMGEMGDEAPRMHELVGAYAAAKKLDMLACVGGELAALMAESARMMGMDEDRIQVFSDYQQVLDRMGGALEKHDVVLVKGSRFVELDRFVEGVC